MTTRLTLPTRVAHAGWLEHEYFGYKLFRDLAGSDTYAALLGLAAKGTRISREHVAVLDDIAGICALGDPHIWPLKLTRLGSAYGRTLPGMTIGNLAFESTKIGPLAATDAAKMLVELREMGESERAASIACRMKKGALPGFGVPARQVDERLLALRECLRRRGRLELANWSFVETLWLEVKRDHDLTANGITAIAAALLDCEMGPDQIGPLLFSLMQSVMLGNALEGAAQAPDILRCLPDDCIDYVGKPARTSPRARAASAAASASTEASASDRAEA